MGNPAIKLVELKKDFEFFVGIDSDGCAFDTMEIKHKECFTPNTINHWGLQAVSKYAREATEFVNLYSKHRGANRFPALIAAIDLLADRDEVKKRGFKAPDLDALRKWVASSNNLSNPALIEYIKTNPDPVLERTMKWSNGVNASVTEIVRDVPPFPYLRESLEKVVKSADLVVVSATPTEALEREWQEHGIAKFPKVIAGQEMGTKAECLAVSKTGRYADDHMLMVGDAPGDLAAARKNNILFYPINPGDEERSWKRFLDEAFDIFLSGKYAGAYEQKLIEEFETYLPENPPWKK